MSEPAAPSDDRRILDELEQLQQAIRARRAPRDDADSGEALRAFARQSPVSPRETHATDGVTTGPAAPAIAAPRPMLPKPDPSPAVPLYGDDAVELAEAKRSRAPMVAAAAIVFGIAAAVLIMRLTTAPESPGAPVASTSPPPAAVTRPIEEATPKPPPADPHALRIDLTSLRRVWLRVSVDGRIALERELAGGERLPFGADRSIVVRAGDAGAVTVKVGNEDQGPLGRDGQVVTRAFTVPEASGSGTR